MPYLSSELLINLLLLTAVFYFTFKAMMKFLNDKKLAFIIGICAAGLTIFYTRYNQEFITYATIGYAGFAILTLLPAIILFHTLYKSNLTGAMRKISWIGYSAIMIYLLHASPLSINPDINKITWTIILVTIALVLLDKKIKDNLSLKRHFGSL